MKKRILIVDSKNAMLQMMHHGCTLPLWDFLSYVKTVMVDMKVHKVLLLNDRGNSEYRIGLQPGVVTDDTSMPELDGVHYSVLPYKGQRKITAAKAAVDNPLKSKKQNLFVQKINQVVDEYAEYFGFINCTIPGIEADDVVAYLTRHPSSENYNFLNVSSDGDWFQLIKGNVVQRSYADKMKCNGTPIPAKIWINQARFKSAYEMTPEEFVTYKAIAGDNGDSVHSPKGMGEGTAMKMVLKYKTIENIRANLGNLNIPRLSKNLTAALQSDSIGYFEHNLKMVNLLHSNDDLWNIFGTSQTFLSSIIEDLDTPPQVNDDEVQELMLESGRTGLVAKYNDWIKPFKGLK